MGIASEEHPASMLVVFEFQEEVEVLGINIFRTYQLPFSSRPPFSDAWFRPIGGGRARILSIRKVMEIDVQGWISMRKQEPALPPSPEFTEKGAEPDDAYRPDGWYT